MTPFAPKPRTKASLTSCGWISQYTFASRTRRAMSCVYCAPKSRIRILSCLLDPVIRGLLGDLDVVNVRFAHSGRSDLHELGAQAQLVYRRAAGVAHASAHAAGELVDHAQCAALVGNPPLHAFGHQLVHVHFGLLEVAVGGALLHGAERAHAAIGLVRARL